VGDEQPAVAENHRRIYAQLGLDAGQVVSPRQVHGSRIAVATAHAAGKTIPDTDGLVTAVPGVALLMRFADCQPILLYDPEHHVIALVHAGWRGVAQGIARRAVEVMGAEFGTSPGSLLAGLGPAIGGCHYVVGHSVATAMGYALPDWRKVMVEEEDHWRFDLPGANAQQLEASGVRQIERAQLCTACRTDEFYSHRAEGGRTGRFAVVAYLAPRADVAADSGDRRSRQTPSQELIGHITSTSPPGFPGLEGGN
jgi:YfiH family protein